MDDRPIISVDASAIEGYSSASRSRYFFSKSCIYVILLLLISLLLISLLLIYLLLIYLLLISLNCMHNEEHYEENEQ